MDKEKLIQNFENLDKLEIGQYVEVPLDFVEDLEEVNLYQHFGDNQNFMEDEDSSVTISRDSEKAYVKRTANNKYQIFIDYEAVIHYYDYDPYYDDTNESTIPYNMEYQFDEDYTLEEIMRERE